MRRLWLVFTLSLLSHAQDLGTGQFPLMAWDFVGDPKNLQLMRDAGINKSLKRSVHGTPVFRPGVKTVKYVSPITGELKPYVARFYWLAPGQGVLLKVE